MKVGIINYGLGNLASVGGALVELGVEPVICQSPDQLDSLSRIILPGVGAFTEGMKMLKDASWPQAISLSLERGATLLGICLGMQMLASRGTEGGLTEGLGLIPGDVKLLSQFGCQERIPHVGWNEVHFERESELLAGIEDRSDFYFVHSYAFEPADTSDQIAVTRYGADIPVLVSRGPVRGCQFHPEKSSRVGLRFLKNFIEMGPC
ncbi:MAG: imidazole glycerol phosphate synthase subunit HisH [Leptospiraceae bacterium]|nr:imidazole glycerol phosphate synthase subunit HisH [Leptospiraceae bacterium]